MRTDAATVSADEPASRVTAPEPPAPQAVEKEVPPRAAQNQELPEPLGYLGTPASSPPATDTIAPPAVRTDATPRSRDELTHHQALREAIGDVTRLGIVEDVVELQPGSLRVSLTTSALEMPSMRYNLERLYTAYRGATPHDPDASVELRRGDQLYGRFTRDGLLLVTPE